MEELGNKFNLLYKTENTNILSSIKNEISINYTENSYNGT